MVVVIVVLVIQFSSVQSLGRLGGEGGGGDMKDDSAELFFQPFLQEALAWAGMSDIHAVDWLLFKTDSFVYYPTSITIFMGAESAKSKAGDTRGGDEGFLSKPCHI